MRSELSEWCVCSVRQNAHDCMFAVLQISAQASALRAELERVVAETPFCCEDAGICVSPTKRFGCIAVLECDSHQPELAIEAEPVSISKESASNVSITSAFAAVAAFNLFIPLLADLHLIASLISLLTKFVFVMHCRECRGFEEALRGEFQTDAGMPRPSRKRTRPRAI
eukprot:2345302-Pleurochrysis_carterae.AAC.1